MNREEWLNIIRKFRNNSSAMFGLIVLILFIFIGILAPLISPFKFQQEPSLVKAKKLIADKAGMTEIMQAFREFNASMFEYYVSNNNSMQLLGSEIKTYSKSAVVETVLLTNLQELVDNFVLDKSYLQNWQTNRRQAIDDLKAEIAKYAMRTVQSAEAAKLISGLDNQTESEFRIKAIRVYNRMENIYRKMMNFDPYLMPIVTWITEPQPPTIKYPFGICNGRDIFYGVVWGTQNAFKIGILVTFVSTIIGLFVGSICAYYGGWLDEILMRIVDMFLSIPYTLSAIVLTTILGTGLDKVVFSLIIFGWMGTARLIRGNILQTKNEQYVLASRALGTPGWMIIIRHILPNSIFPVIVLASMRIGSIVITAAALSFLGIGAPQGYADWGSILSYGRNWMLSGGSNPFQYWFTILFPGTIMVFFVLSWNLVGDALRDIFDPKMRL